MLVIVVNIVFFFQRRNDILAYLYVDRYNLITIDKEFQSTEPSFYSVSHVIVFFFNNLTIIMALNFKKNTKLWYLTYLIIDEFDVKLIIFYLYVGSNGYFVL